MFGLGKHNKSKHYNLRLVCKYNSSKISYDLKYQLVQNCRMTKNDSFYAREESERTVFREYSMFLPAEKMVYIYPFSKDKRGYVRSFFSFW